MKPIIVLTALLLLFGAGCQKPKEEIKYAPESEAGTAAFVSEEVPRWQFNQLDGDTDRSGVVTSGGSVMLVCGKNAITLSGPDIINLILTLDRMHTTGTSMVYRDASQMPPYGKFEVTEQRDSGSYAYTKIAYSCTGDNLATSTVALEKTQWIAALKDTLFPTPTK